MTRQSCISTSSATWGALAGLTDLTQLQFSYDTVGVAQVLEVTKLQPLHKLKKLTVHGYVFNIMWKFHLTLKSKVRAGLAVERCDGRVIELLAILVIVTAWHTNGMVSISYWLLRQACESFAWLTHEASDCMASTCLAPAACLTVVAA